MKNIGLIGHGWLGKRIARQLSESNIIYATTTSKDKVQRLKQLGYHAYLQEFSDSKTNSAMAPWEILDSLDVIIITVPFSRRTPIERLAHRFENLIKFIQDYKGQIFLMSSTGIYPQKPGEISEETYLDKDLHSNLIFIENLMREQFPQLNILRLGGLMGDDRLLKNYNISDTTGLVNYVHNKDICLIIEEMIKQEMTSKLYNIVAPLHPSKQEILNQQLNKHEPIVKPNPARIILSHKVQRELSYTFKYPDPKFFD